MRLVLWPTHLRRHDLDQTLTSKSETTPAQLRDCSDCPIRHRAVCANCEPKELTALEEIKYYKEFRPGDTIVWAGQDLDFVASVVVGMAALSRTMEDGRRQITGLLLSSDFLGRPGRASVRYDVSAISDVTLCCFRRKPFEDLVASTPHIGQRLLEMSMDELDAAREWMLVLGRKTARERIASLLAMVAQRDLKVASPSATGPLTIDLPLSREGIADSLGLTLVTASRQLSPSPI